MIDERIPVLYQKFWHPYKTDEALYHLTTKANLENIKKLGYLEPRDPSPKHWSGLKGIFMACPSDALYEGTQKNVMAHVGEKGEELIRLHINTKNQLYRSSDSERTFQVISLDPIKVEDIKKVEIL